jgi:hypothetical protein
MITHGSEISEQNMSTLKELAAQSSGSQIIAERAKARSTFGQIEYKEPGNISTG